MSTSAAAASVRQYSQGLKTLRSIAHQLRQEQGQFQTKVSSMPVMENFRSIIRAHDVTDQRLCRSPEELQFIGNCYRTYLISNAKYGELFHRHFGKGEKTVEQAAETVGLRLPEKPTSVD